MSQSNRIFRFITSIALLFAVILSFLVSNVEICKATSGNILYVGGSGAGNYTFIQDAVNNSNDNDTLFVYAGQYNENISIQKSISLIGSDKNQTIISNEKGLYCIFLKSQWINISGFTIINNRIGAYAVGFSNINISGNIFKNNIEGIHLDNSSNNIISNNLVENSKKRNKYGIVCYSSSNNLISENTFINNAEAISLSRWSNFNTLSNNVITNYSYGVRIDFSSNNFLQKNYARNGERGFYLTFSKYNNITFNNFYNNTDYAIYLDDLENNVVTPNYFENNYRDVGEVSSPPDIKAPGFEISILLLALFLIFIIYRRKQK